MLKTPVDLKSDTVLKARWFRESVWALFEVAVCSEESSSMALPFSQAPTSILTDTIISVRRSLSTVGF